MKASGWVWLLMAFALFGCTHAPTAVSQLKIETDKPGLTQIPRRRLEQAGLSLSQFSVKSLALSQAHQPIPFFIEDETLYFIAAQSTNRYSTHQVYWLTADQPGVELEKVAWPRSAAPANSVPIYTTYETNNIYESRAAPFVADPWFWQTVGHGAITELTFDYPHDPLGDVHLSIDVWGLTSHPTLSPDHDVTIGLNGQVIDTAVWTGQSPHTIQFMLPAHSLNHGQNKLTFDNSQNHPDLIDTFLIDQLHMTVEAVPTLTQQIWLGSPAARPELDQRPFLFSLADYPQPTPGHTSPSTRLPQPPQFLVSTLAAAHQPAAISTRHQSQWATPASGADFVIILADKLWEPALQPLIETRLAEGIKTAVLTIDEIYDSFGSGAPHPQAIQAFLQHAHAAWPLPRPRYLLLIGDASIDFRADAHEPLPAGVPSLLVPASFGGETLSDSLLGDIDGDGQTDLAIGRWPVRSKLQLTLLVEKSLTMETAAANSSAPFIIDSSEPRFTAVAQRLSPVAANSLVTTYIGHGSVQAWGSQHLEQNLAIQTPILLQMTCLTGLFGHPDHPALAEKILLQANGPSHTIAATSLTLSNHQESFTSAFLQQLNQPSPQRIGDSFFQAQRTLRLEITGEKEVHDTFLLFGDPTTPLPRK